MRCWSVARAVLHLTDAEFYRLTPRQYFTLLEQHERVVEHQELLAGVIASTTANWAMNAPKESLAPADFMPSRWARKARMKPRKTPIDLTAQVRALFSADPRLVTNGN